MWGMCVFSEQVCELCVPLPNDMCGVFLTLDWRGCGCFLLLRAGMAGCEAISHIQQWNLVSGSVMKVRVVSIYNKSVYLCLSKAGFLEKAKKSYISYRLFSGSGTWLCKTKIRNKNTQTLLAQKSENSLLDQADWGFLPCVPHNNFQKWEENTKKNSDATLKNAEMCSNVEQVWRPSVANTENLIPATC